MPRCFSSSACVPLFSQPRLKSTLAIATVIEMCNIVRGHASSRMFGEGARGRDRERGKEEGVLGSVQPVTVRVCEYATTQLLYRLVARDGGLIAVDLSLS